MSLEPSPVAPPPPIGSLWMHNEAGAGPLRVASFDADWVRLEGAEPLRYVVALWGFYAWMSPWPSPKGSRFRRRPRAM